MNSTYCWLNIIHFKKKGGTFFPPEQRLEAKSKRGKSWTVEKRKKKKMEREWEIQVWSHMEREVRNRNGAEGGGRSRESEIGIKDIE